MAGASAGHMAKKSSGRFKVLRTGGKTKNGRKATKVRRIVQRIAKAVYFNKLS